MKDYHAKPVLAVRVSADVQDWARQEAKRRDEGIGEFVEAALSEYRDRHGKEETSEEKEQ